MFYPPIAGYVIITIITAILAVASSRGDLARNKSIGIRTKHTLRSDAAWYAAQRAGVPHLRAIAIIAATHAAVLLTVALVALPEALGHTFALTGYVLTVAIAIAAWRAANRAATIAAEAQDRQNVPQ